MINGELKTFQQDVSLKMQARKKALLAYAPGSGKTIITLDVIEAMMHSGDIKIPVVILAGTSLLHQWAAEIDRFTDSTSLVIGGTPAARKRLYKEFRNWDVTGIDYLIVTYSTLTNDAREFLTLPRGFVVADESVAIKSPKSKRSKVVKALFADTPVRFGLSGTPIENGKPEELFSQMEFIDPDVLGPFYDFDRTFIVRNQWGGVDHYRNMPLLNKTVKDAVFFKGLEDADIAREMPEEVVKPPALVTLDASNRKLYNKIAEDIARDLHTMSSLGGGSFSISDHYLGNDQEQSQRDALRGMLMSKITVGRMLLDHHDLVRSSAESFVTGDGDGSSYAADLAADGHLDRVKKTPKLDALEELVSNALANPKSKLIIFSVYRQMLDLIDDRLGYPAVIYHGGLSAKERHNRKTAFQTDPNIRIFISSDAGGMGVDLPQANALINYDMPWQAGALEQRNARPRRVSSEWSHLVIEQLMVRSSLEEWQFAMLNQKSAVSRAILQGKGITDNGDVGESLESLLSFL